ncbi:MAG: hypothetical protein JW874_14630 [Spirochaetales bacterium]|nr:hypothetical protein [Spirochaetales bacterium]
MQRPERIRTFRGISLSDTYEDVRAAYRTDLERPFMDQAILMFFNTIENKIIPSPWKINYEPENAPYMCNSFPN